MDTALRKEVRNCDLKISKDKREFLCYPMEGLVSCTIEEAEDGVVFLFEQGELEDKLEECKTLLKKPRAEKIHFLLNCSKLLALFDEYECSLSLDNLMVNMNLTPKVLLRDARDNESREFLVEYKALIGSLLVPKYSYEDFIEGGEDLFKKDKFLTKIAPLESVTEIEELLLEEYKYVTAKLKRTKKLVPKGQILFVRIVLPILIVCLGVAGFFLYQAYFREIPYGNSMIEARNAYIRNQPLHVQHALRGYDIGSLSYETKYILARSYVITEPLTVEQIGDILRGLTLRTEEQIFDYWIYLGRLQFEEAIDIAMRFNDNELLLLAYLKYEVAVLDDPTRGGDERIPLINRIQSSIERLLEGREEALEQMLEESLLEDSEEGEVQEDEVLEEEVQDDELPDDELQDDELQENELQEDEVQGDEV
jgi:type VII secretion protein EssB